MHLLKSSRLSNDAAERLWVSLRLRHLSSESIYGQVSLHGLTISRSHGGHCSLASGPGVLLV
eukprot:1111225-Pyramimonas_sp.AAC.1